ncbi:MAG: DUF2141 domain-containing protein [Myxococcota bacterium]
MHRPALLAALLGLLVCARARAAEITVVIRGLESSDGNVLVEVFGESQRAAFPYADRGVTAEIRVQAKALQQPGKQASVSIGDLAPGSYAVVAIHDANANGDIDLNMFGIPTEGYGFSNGARPGLGPPSFDAAAVAVGADAPTRIEITLSH